MKQKHSSNGAEKEVIVHIPQLEHWHLTVGVCVVRNFSAF